QSQCAPAAVGLWHVAVVLPNRCQTQLYSITTVERATIFHMSVTSPQTKPASTPRLPEELVASTTFLLKRLGMTAKERAMEAYEEIGLHPYHHAVLIAVDEGHSVVVGKIGRAHV